MVRGGADVVQNGRRMRVAVSPLLDATALVPGSEVLLDETQSIVGIAEAPARVASAEASRWRLAEAYHGRNVSAAYRELEWE